MATNKRNTYNVDNIELAAVNYYDPETILIEREREQYNTASVSTQVSGVLSFNMFDEVDVLVLKGKMSREEAAIRQGVSYNTYQRRLHRRINAVRRLIK